jgi:hypothetical protein
MKLLEMRKSLHQEEEKASRRTTSEWERCGVLVRLEGHQFTFLFIWEWFLSMDRCLTFGFACLKRRYCLIWEMMYFAVYSVVSGKLVFVLSHKVSTVVFQRRDHGKRLAVSSLLARVVSSAFLFFGFIISIGSSN